MLTQRKLRSILVVLVIAVGAVVGALISAGGADRTLAAANALEESSKIAASEEVAPGQSTNYQIVLVNNSDSEVTNVVVTDDLPSTLTFVPDSEEIDPTATMWGRDLAPDFLTFTISTIQANSTVTISFDVTLAGEATPGSTITNTAVISSAAEVYETEPATFTVSPTPDLQIYDPDNGSVITERPDTILEISGRAWAQFDPAPFPDPPVLEPIENFGGGGSYSVNWTAVDDADNYVLQESADPSFAAPTTYPVAAPETTEFIPGKSNGTYYYRVAAYNADNRPSRWSDVETVTVTNASAMSGQGAEIGAETFDWSQLAVNDIITVQVSVDGGTEWHPASVVQNPGGWWEWSYDWTLPEADGVEYPIQARAMYTAGGEFSEDTITVTINNYGTIVYMPIIAKRWPPVPYAPVLNEINPSGSDFTVSWTYTSQSAGVPAPYEYQLQEASDSAFTQDVRNYTVVDDTSRAFTGMKGGTYYYRVRGRNNCGFGDCYGEWSNVESVTLGRVYNFGSSTEGWAIKRSDEPANDDDLRDPFARDGNLVHAIWGRADWSILSPLEEAPSAPYTIRAYVDIVDNDVFYDDETYTAKQEMAYGIIFGGNAGTPCPADRFDDGGCLDHYYRLLVVYDDAGPSFKWSLKRVDRHEDDKGIAATLIDWRTVSGADYQATGWNEWEIEVGASGTNNIRISLNGDEIGSASDTRYVKDPYFGIYLESPGPFGAVATKWDWFRVE